MKIDLTERELFILREAIVYEYDLNFERHTLKEYHKLLRKLRGVKWTKRMLR